MPSYLTSPVSSTSGSSPASSSTSSLSSLSSTSSLSATTSGATCSLPCSSSTSSTTTTLPRPIPNSYWATPYLLACEYPYAPKLPPSRPQKLDSLLLSGIRSFIDLTEPNELQPYTQILSARAHALSIPASSLTYHRFPIRDRSLPASLEHMRAIMQVLRENERAGRVTAVHCRGGIGRTGMVVGCWLVESGRVGCGREALGVIAREWGTVEKCVRFPCSPETGPQFEFVMKWKKGGEEDKTTMVATMAVTTTATGMSSISSLPTGVPPSACAPPLSPHGLIEIRAGL